MPQTVQKVCCVCGADVANQKRTKDAAGNYYCQPCYDAAIAEANTGIAVTPTPPAPDESADRSSPNQHMILKARWFAAIAAVSLLTIGVDAVLFNSDIGGRSGSVIIPVMVTFWLAFLVLAFMALWFARNWGKLVKGRKQPLFGRYTRPLVIAGKVFALVMILLGVVTIFLPSPTDKRSSSSSSADAESDLPAIHIDDRHGEVKFTDWKVKGYNLVGTLVANGPWKIDTITYTTKRNGVVKQRGDVSVPGDYFSKGEAVEATISCWEDPKGLDVTIEVGY